MGRKGLPGIADILSFLLKNFTQLSPSIPSSAACGALAVPKPGLGGGDGGGGDDHHDKDDNDKNM